MSSLFNYNCFKTTLDKATRSLFVDFHPDRNSLNLELLFELESLLAWCTNRVEIRSVVFRSYASELLKGLDAEEITNFSEKKLKTVQQKLQKIVFSMHHLPQTVIMDLGRGAHNIAAEFALAADIRIASTNINMSFNHNTLGVVAASGGITMLNALVGQAVTRNWLLSGAAISATELKFTGLVFQSYDETNRDEVLEKLLKQINAQSDVARIQTKMAVFENMRSDADKQLKYDSQISNATMLTGDWKNPKESMNAKSMSYAVKLSLVKDETLDH